MQIFMKEYRRTLAVFAIVCFYIGGCTSDSTSVAPPPPVIPVSPRVGSSFLYYSITLDSVGTITSIDSAKLYGDTVLATGISQFGKTNVTQFTPNFIFQYVNYETNGNISYYVNPAAGQTGEWITVPIDSMGTHGSLDPNAADSTWYSYTGIGALGLASQQFNAESFDIYSGPTALGIQGVTAKEWYDTASGVLLEQNTLAVRDSAGQFGTGSGYEIAKFNLK
jgi:hypothetical protein